MKKIIPLILLSAFLVFAGCKTQIIDDSKISINLAEKEAKTGTVTLEFSDTSRTVLSEAHSSFSERTLKDVTASFINEKTKRTVKATKDTELNKWTLVEGTYTVEVTGKVKEVTLKGTVSGVEVTEKGTSVTVTLYPVYDGKGKITIPLSFINNWFSIGGEENYLSFRKDELDAYGINPDVDSVLVNPVFVPIEENYNFKGTLESLMNNETYELESVWTYEYKGTSNSFYMYSLSSISLKSKEEIPAGFYKVNVNLQIKTAENSYNSVETTLVDELVEFIPGYVNRDVEVFDPELITLSFDKETIGDVKPLIFEKPTIIHVSIDYKSGSGTSIINSSDDNFIYFTTPTKNEQIIAGYYLDPTFNNPIGCYDTEINSNSTLYAKFENPYTVTFKNGEETLKEITVPGNTEFYLMTFAGIIGIGRLGYSIDSFTAPIEDGKIIEGWYDSYENKLDTNNFVITEDTILSVKWIDSCEISFDANGGTLAEGTTSVIVPQGSNIYYYWYLNNGRTTYFRNEDSGSYYDAVPIPTKDGYEFAGWEIGEASLCYPNMIQFNDSTVTLTAKWAEPCTINFVTNCDAVIPSITVPSGLNYIFTYEGEVYRLRPGVIDSSTQNISYGNNALFAIYSNESNYPKKGSSTLEGWYTTENFSSQPLDFNNPFEATENGTITLYAKWSSDSNSSFTIE